MRAHDRKRHRYIGASEIAAVAGLDVNDSRFDVWARHTGRVTPEVTNPHIERGIELEPVIRNRVRKMEGVEELLDPEEGEFYLHENGILGAHPDGRGRFVIPELNPDGSRWGPLEIKAPDVQSGLVLREQGLDAPKLMQLQATMGCMGLDYGVFAIHLLSPWGTLRFPMPLDTALFGWMAEESARFWHDHIEKDVAPELFPASPPPDLPQLGGSLLHVIGDPEWTAMMEEYDLLRQAKKQAEIVWTGRKLKKGEERDPDEPLPLKDRLIAKMIELGTEEAEGDGWKFYYRPNTTKRYFTRGLITKLGPFDPARAEAVLEEELGGPMVQQIMARLRMEARLTGEDDRFFVERIEAYGPMGFPQKDPLNVHLGPDLKVRSVGGDDDE